MASTALLTTLVARILQRAGQGAIIEGTIIGGPFRTPPMPEKLFKPGVARVVIRTTEAGGGGTARDDELAGGIGGEGGDVDGGHGSGAPEAAIARDAVRGLAAGGPWVL